MIVADIGLALMGKAQHQPGLLGLGLIAATFQITAHSFAKAGLFAAVATVEHSTGTSDMERLGGLYRRLPAAAVATLAGGAALAALPPFSGFVSEWLGFEGLMQGFPRQRHRIASRDGARRRAARADRRARRACVRARHRDDFLRLPARPLDRPAAEPSRARIGMGLLAVASLAIGVAAPWVINVLERALTPIGGVPAGHISEPGWLVEPGYANFASISPTVLALTLTRLRARRGLPRYLVSLRTGRRRRCGRRAWR